VTSSSLCLSEIWIYPIKSLGGIRLQASRVLKKGLAFDRRFMLVDVNNVAMTQRQYPEMALFKTSIIDDVIRINYKHETVEIPLSPTDRTRETLAKVWDDSVNVYEPDASLSSWFTQKLRVPCRLLFFPEENSRAVDKTFLARNENVSLADAYPILIIGQESLSELNSRLSSPVPMNRFRPNLVFSGGRPFEEDSWRDFTIGAGKFEAIKPCARCVLTTVDQETAVKGTEPLKTLSTYRTKNNKVYFGQNVILLSGIDIKEGDRITVNTFREQI
jgi:uncharacterized protein